MHRCETIQLFHLFVLGWYHKTRLITTWGTYIKYLTRIIVKYNDIPITSDVSIQINDFFGYHVNVMTWKIPGNPISLIKSGQPFNWYIVSAESPAIVFRFTKMY